MEAAIDLAGLLCRKFEHTAYALSALTHTKQLQPLAVFARSQGVWNIPRGRWHTWSAPPCVAKLWLLSAIHRLGSKQSESLAANRCLQIIPRACMFCVINAGTRKDVSSLTKAGAYHRCGSSVCLLLILGDLETFQLQSLLRNSVVAQHWITGTLIAVMRDSRSCVLQVCQPRHRHRHATLIGTDFKPCTATSRYKDTCKRLGTVSFD